MEITVLREEPAGSGTFVTTGEELRGVDANTAAEMLAARVQRGEGRFAMLPIETLNLRPVEQPTYLAEPEPPHDAA